MDEIIVNFIDDFKNIMHCIDAKLLKIIQLEKGEFYIHLRYRNLNNTCILFAFNSYTKFEVEAISTENFYTFYTSKSSENNILNNIQTTNNMLFVIPPNYHFHFFLKYSSCSYCIQIEKNIIENKFGKLHYEVLEVKDSTLLNEFIQLLISKLSVTQYNFVEENNYLENILNKINILLNNSSPILNDKVQLFRKIINYMDQNYKEDLTIEDISIYFNISSRTMSNLFNEMIGYSPKKYLIANKLNKLKMAITESDDNLSISKLMINNNLQFQSQVSKNFKEFFNTTPFEYKKELRKK